MNHYLSAYIAAKQAASAAARDLISAEEALIKDIDKRQADDFGDETYDLDGLKVVISRKMNLSCSADAREGMVAAFEKANFSPSLLPFKEKIELNESLYKKLKDESEKAFNVASYFVTVKPAKVAVSVKL